MDMIKRFSEIVVDRNGTRIPRNETENYRVFSDSSLNLSIYDPNPTSFFNRHFGKYPVIYLDFKDLSCSSYEEFLESFKSMISDVFKTYYYYLLSSDKLYLLEVDELKCFYAKIKNDKLSVTDLKKSIRILSGYLFNHFNNRVIVLIDEYDAPIQKAIFTSCLLYTSRCV